MNTDNKSEEDKIYKKIETTFRNDVIHEILKSNFTITKNKITEESVELMNELLKILVCEATMRSAQQAKMEEKNIVVLEHVESILPQLILDFP